MIGVNATKSASIVPTCTTNGLNFSFMITQVINLSCLDVELKNLHY